MSEKWCTTRRGFLGGSASIVAASMLGFGRSANAATKRIGFSMESYAVPRWKNVDKPFFERAVLAGGYQPVVTQANFDVAQQLRDVENFISTGVDALVIVAIDQRAGINMARLAKREGIPVIAYNQLIPSQDISAFISRDNRNVGRQAVLAAEKAVGLEGKFVLVSGQAGNAVAEECTAGYMEGLKSAIDNGKAEIVSHEFIQNWDPETARKQAENALTAHGNDIKGFFCNNDSLANGVIKALQSQGLEGKIFVSGQDASTEGCRNMLLKRMSVSSFTRFDLMGQMAGELAVRLASGAAIDAPNTVSIGKSAVPLFSVEDYNVTPSNMAEYFKRYSPAMVDASAALKGIPDSDLPPDLLAFK